MYALLKVPISNPNPNPNGKVVCLEREKIDEAVAHEADVEILKAELDASLSWGEEARLAGVSAAAEAVGLLSLGRLGYRMHRWRDDQQAEAILRRDALLALTVWGIKLWGYKMIVRQRDLARRSDKRAALITLGNVHAQISQAQHHLLS